MNADLMGSPCQKVNLDKACLIEGFHQDPPGFSVFSGLRNGGHFYPINGMPADRHHDAPAGSFHMAVNHGKVLLLDAAQSELFGQACLGFGIFCGNQYAGGVFVQAMHDAGAYLAGNAGQVRAMVQQCVDEGAGVMSRRRMNDHAGRLVQYEQILVLIR